MTETGRPRERWVFDLEAVRVSLHRSEVGKLEGGGRTCRIDTLLRVAGAMAARPEELLDGIVWVPAPETKGSFSFNSRPLSHQFRRSET